MTEQLKHPYCDLTLNNGKTATFLYTDFWSRPIYEITAPSGNAVKVCSTELDGQSLDIYNEEWEEPVSPVKHDYQPA